MLKEGEIAIEQYGWVHKNQYQMSLVESLIEFIEFPSNHLLNQIKTYDNFC